MGNTIENTTQWVLDPTHSEILFKVKHLMITNINGSFRKFHGEATSVGNDFTKGKVKVTIDAASIDTNEEKRDAHLKSADFLEAEKYPDLIFEGSSLIKTDSTNYKLIGTLTIKGKSNQVTLDVEFGGINKDPWGNEKAGFSVTGKVNRKEWGLNWNAALETGGVLVGDEVKINCEVQFTKQN
jgi:polyisoprenoid-binding protein YceI